MAWLLVLLVVSTRILFGQAASLPSQETLNYDVEWRLVTAGKAKLQLNQTPGQDGLGWRVNLHLESAGLVSKLFKVEDDYAVNLSPALCAVSSQMTSHEGNRQRETKVTFDRDARKASYQERDLARNRVVASQEVDTPDCVHDVIGGVYFLRTLNLEPGQSTEVAVSDGKKSVMAKVEAQQREDIKAGETRYQTIRYEIFLFDNVLYRRSAHLHVWLTDDRRKVPVQIRVRMPITIGTITLHLEKHE